MRTSILKAVSIGTLAVLFLLFTGTTGCKVYSFADVSIPDSVKTVRINFIENRAQYNNPRLSPSLTDRLKQKIVNQTRLIQTNRDDAHYDVSAVITNYAVSTSGISSSTTTTGGTQRQSSMNRLTVTVNVTLNDQLSNKTQDFVITRSFDFDSRQSLQAAETALGDTMIRDLTDDIFNRIFSNW